MSRRWSALPPMRWLGSSGSKRVRDNALHLCAWAPVDQMPESELRDFLSGGGAAAPVGKITLQHGAERLEVDRFGQVVVHPGIQTGLAVFRHRFGGYGDNFQAGWKIGGLGGLGFADIAGGYQAAKSPY